MASLPFYWIDAFTDKKLGGNPCAVVLDADGLSAAQMQAIAKEMNLSETAFVLRSSKADFGARYFTPEEELPFAGHPTVATIYSLIEAKRIQFKGPEQKVSLELPAGVIPIQVQRESGQVKIVMSQLAPKFMGTYRPEEVAAIYGLSVKDFLPNAPIQTVSTGSPVLMLPLVSHEALRRVRCVDYDAYQKFRATGDFLFAHHFVIEGATEQGTTFARSLGSTPTSHEDPFTGSATGCMAAYLWKYGLISSPRFVAEQGHWMGRPGKAEVEVVGEPEAIQTIRVAGQAIKIIEGSISI